MPKLTYWLAQQHTDHPCYDIVARTKREALELIAKSGCEYDPPVKRELHYKDGFDLFDMLTGEGGSRRLGY